MPGRLSPERPGIAAHTPVAKGTAMHELITTPLGKQHLILRPGSPKALQLPAARFNDRRSAWTPRPRCRVPPTGHRLSR